MHASFVSYGVTVLCLLLLLLLCVESTHAQVITKLRYQGALNTRRHEAFKNDMSNAPTQWYTEQLVNHFDPTDKRVFAQRYYVNDTYFVQGSDAPVLYLLGGEGPMSGDSVNGHFILNTYAQQWKGLIVALEHRFYGQSQPFGSSDPQALSTENMKYLTTEQALADFAQFRDYIVKTYKLSNRNKWISFGGSYSGNLSAWLRLKYPHLIHAAMASSAPVRAKLDFFEYMQVVQASLGSKCSAKLAQALTTQLNGYLDSGKAEDLKYLSQTLQTCSPVTTNKDDQTTLVGSLSDLICGVVQYNIDNNSLGRRFNITQFCDIMLDEKSYATPLDAYAHFIQIYGKQMLGLDCVESSYQHYINQLRNTSADGNDNAAGRAWTWQYCTEYGYLQPAEGSGQPFSQKLTLDWFLRSCKQIFPEFANIYPQVDTVNRIFGSDQPQGSRIVFTNGNIDPWHVLGVTPNNKVDPKQQPAFLMQGTAHCADLYPPRDSDLDSLKQVRAKTQAYLEQWLKEQ